MTNRVTKADAVIFCIAAAIAYISGKIMALYYGYDRTIFLIIVLCVSVAASAIASSITQLKNRKKHQMKIIVIASIIIGVLGLAADFAVDWKMCSIMFTIYRDFTYPILTGVIAGMTAMAKQLLTVKYRRSSEQLYYHKIPCDNIIVNNLCLSIADDITDEIINMRHERHLVQDKTEDYLDGERDPIESFKNDIKENENVFLVTYDRVAVGYILCSEDSETLYVKECYISEIRTPFYLDMYVVLKQFFELFPREKTIDFKLPDDDKVIQKYIEAGLSESFCERIYDMQEDGMHIIAENL